MTPPLVPTDEEQKRIKAEFGPYFCGCDGAMDNGCPLCTDARLQEWLTKIRELPEKTVP